MAILNKEDRLQYIIKAAARIRREKELQASMFDADQETVTEVFKAETDFSLVDEFCGMVSEGVAKIHGGLRKMPVIIP